jgi:hypothetical protein
LDVWEAVKSDEISVLTSKSEGGREENCFGEEAFGL